MSDYDNKPVDFDASAERAAQAAKDAAHDMEEAARRAAADATAAAQRAADSVEQGAQQAAHSAGKAIDDLTAELNRVGGQVADQAKAVWESDQRKEFSDQVVKGLTSVANVVEEQVKKLGAHPDTQRFLGKVEETTNKVVEQARGSKSLQEAAEAVMKGLSGAALAIEKWLGQQTATKSGDSTLSAVTPDFDEPQEIMIQRPAAVQPQPPVAPPNEPDSEVSI